MSIPSLPLYARLLTNHVGLWRSRKGSTAKPAPAARLARLAGIDGSTLSRWLSGSSRPDVSALGWRQLCAELDLTEVQRAELESACVR